MAIPYKEQTLPAVKQIAFDVQRWGGINRIKGSTQDFEMADCMNMAVDHFPYAAPRKSRACILAEAGIRRVVCAEGNRLYFLQNRTVPAENGTEMTYENALCCLEEGNVTMVQDVDGSYVTIPDVRCTANYDGAMLFFPDMRCYRNGILEALSVVLSFDVQNAESESEGEYTHCERYWTATHTHAGRFGADFVIQLKHKYDDFSTFAERFETLPGRNYLRYRCSIYTTDGAEIATLVMPFAGRDVPETTVDPGRYSAAVDGGAATLRFNFGDVLQDETAVCLRFSVECGTDTGTYGRFFRRVISDFVEGCSHTLALSASRLVPAVAYGVVYNNRVVGVRDSEVRASALGNFLDFTTFVDADGNPDATGAYATDVGSDGPFTGIAVYNSVLLLFKRHIVYRMHGSMPYTMTEITKTGCIDHDSICEIDGALYWASDKGIVKYTGGVPTVISHWAGFTLTELCKSGTDGRRYYCYNGEQIYVYDTRYHLWHIEDAPNVRQFYSKGTAVYMLCDDGIYLLGSGTERVAWEFETKDYTFGVPERKNLSRLWVRVFMERYSRLEVYVRSDCGVYSRVALYQADRDRVFDFKVRVKKCDSFSLKFKGEGDVRILDLHGRVTLSSGKHRSGQMLDVFRR